MLLTILSVFFTFLAFLGQFFVLIGSIKNSPFIRDINLFRFDFNVGVNVGNTNATLLGNSTIPEYTTVSLWGYCEGTNDEITYCSDPTLGYTFARIGSGISNKDQDPQIDTNLNKILIAFIMPATIITFLALITGIVSYKKRLIEFVASMLALIGFGLTASAFIVDILVYRNIYNAIFTNNNNVNSHLANGTWVILGAAFFLAIASGVFMMACCSCGRTKHTAPPPEHFVAQREGHHSPVNDEKTIVDEEPVTNEEFVQGVEPSTARKSPFFFLKKKKDEPEAQVV